LFGGNTGGSVEYVKDLISNRRTEIPEVKEII
jgi:hypothetical protein